LPGMTWCDLCLQYDPLLEKGKGKFSKAEQEKKKRQNEWSGRANQ